MTLHYRNMFRLIDVHGVMHLAFGHMRPSEALCGEPPLGNQWSDEYGTAYRPGRATGEYRSICPVCNERFQSLATPESMR